MKELIDSQKLDFWLFKKLNVLFTGKHGVGKTSAVLNAFERRNMKYLYFSAPTCDPFIDFVGIPRVIEKDGKNTLELIRQSYMEDDSLQAIFIDEYNRGPKKMRNAVMELIQFKSINGRKYPNLEVVWAAINPDDGSFDVEPLDPAQEDRFHVKLEIPFEPCPVYLENKYGTYIAECATNWWSQLKGDALNAVTPRRLCYALDFFAEEGDIRDILPEITNPARLIKSLSTKPPQVILEELYIEDNPTHIVDFMSQENNITRCLKSITEEPKYMEKFLPYLGNERMASLMSNETILNHCLLHMDTPSYKAVFTGILKSKSNLTVIEKIKKRYIESNMTDEEMEPYIFSNVNFNAPMHFKENDNPFDAHLSSIYDGYDLKNLTIPQKEKVWNKLLENIPNKIEEPELTRVCWVIEKVITQQRKGNYPWTKYAHFVEVVNHVSKNLLDNRLTPYEVTKKLPQCYNDLFFSEKENDCFIKPEQQTLFDTTVTAAWDPAYSKDVTVATKFNFDGTVERATYPYRPITSSANDYGGNYVLGDYKPFTASNFWPDLTSTAKEPLLYKGPSVDLEVNYE